MTSLVLTAVLVGLQAPPASLTGVVRDAESGQAVEGVAVTLSDLGRSTLTDGRGRYRLDAVPAGPQHLLVRGLGYAERSLHALVPREGTLELHIALRPDPIRLAAVDVTSMGPLRSVEVGDDPAPPDLSLDLSALRHHPLLPEPDAFQALVGGDVTAQAEAPGGLHVRGGASDQTAFVLDDVPILSPYHAAGVFSAWSPETLARIELSSAAPSPAGPHALAGVVSGTTRAPGPTLSAEGSLSSAQARTAMRGPLAPNGAGFLLGVRSGFPGILAPDDEPSYLAGSTFDVLAKLEAPLAGGSFRLLAYESRNHLDAAALAEGEETPEPAAAAHPRNAFGWWSRSLGLGWRRANGRRALRLLAWSAQGGATSDWWARSTPLALDSRRDDLGVLAFAERRAGETRTRVGARVEHTRTRYGTRAGFETGPSADALTRTRDLVTTGFVEHGRAVGRRVRAEAAVALTHGADVVVAGPRAQLRWRPGDAVALTASYARLHQYAQSLRNPESVVAAVFPVDLHLGAGQRGAPLAESEQWSLTGEMHLLGFRLGALAWHKSMEGLVLVAPSGGEPFATGGFDEGSGRARGVALDLSGRSARYQAIATWGWQSVHYRAADVAWVPVHGSSHLLDGGVSLFPSATLELKLGASAMLGRRATAFVGALEWESCNLLDVGCEFGGSPDHTGETLGGSELPAYVRLDLGVRKHWHLRLGGRDAQLSAFGTVTNVLGRGNLLTWARHPVSRERTPIEMRPTAPLVVGLDWRF